MPDRKTTEAWGDDARLESLGYKPQLNRVLGLFANFSVAFTYLSPMVGIYSLFALGVAAGGPAYVWLTWIPVIGMMFVALVFGELASHYPVAGALYQYSKFSVGPSYGWFVGWFYGVALLITVAAVDTGVVTYTTALANSWFGWDLDPTNHLTILVITVSLLVIQTVLNITGARVMARVAQFGVYVEILGTLGIAVILAIAGFHHGLGFLFSTENVQYAASNPLKPGLRRTLADRRRAHRGAGTGLHLLRVRVGRGHLGGDQGRRRQGAAGDATGAAVGRCRLVRAGRGPAARDARRQGPGGEDGGRGRRAVHPGGAAQGLQDLLLLLIIFAFFSCGTSVQGAGSRLAFSYARDGALPGSRWLSAVNPRFRTPTNALLAGAVVTVLFVLLVFYSPAQDVHLGLHHLPGQHQRPGGAGVVRGQRHLPVVPAHGDRGHGRAGAGLGPGGPFPRSAGGGGRLRHRRGLPRADAA